MQLAGSWPFHIIGGAQAIGWGDMTANQSFEPTPQSGAAQFHR